MSIGQYPGYNSVASSVSKYMGNAVKIADIWGGIIVNVKTFGARGDGVTDDSAAIKAAITFAKNFNVRRIVFPGRFLINSPMDLTNLKTNGISIEGVHMSFEYGKGSEIILNTGAIGIDCTGSSRMNFSNIKITSRTPGLSNPSKVGVVFSRSEVHQFADRCNIYNCMIDMHSEHSANGGVGTIAVYNYAAEIFKIDTSELKGDIPIVFTQNNIYNIQSTLTPTRLPASTNTMTAVVVMASALMSRKSYACVMENLGDALFKINTDCYPPSGSGLTKGIADFRMEGDFNGRIHIDNIHSELFNKFIELNGKLDNFELTGLKSGLTDKVIDMVSTTGRLRNGIIRLYNSLDRNMYPTGKTNLIYSTATDDYGLNTLEIYMGSADQIYAPNQRLTSSKITSTVLVTDTDINVKAGSRYELLCWDGVPTCQIRATVAQSIPSNTSTYLTFDTIDENAGLMFNSGSPDKLTVTKAGMYMIQLSATMNTLTGNCQINVIKTGAAYASQSENSSNANAPRMTASALIRCEVGDTIQANVTHNNATAVSTFIEGRSSVVLRAVRIAP